MQDAVSRWPMQLIFSFSSHSMRMACRLSWLQNHARHHTQP